MDGKITEFMDIEYFKQFPAPLFELFQAQHHTRINATIPFFGPMLYWFARGVNAFKILEIGHAEGYTAFYLAHAAKDNGIRYGKHDAKYYGIDIALNDYCREGLKRWDLPADIRCLDSMKLTPETFKGETFDLIFQDGCHDREHILHELDTLYPQLTSGGYGYWVYHDCFGMGEDVWHEIMQMIKDGKYNFEYCRFLCTNGMAILRKLDGFDENKKYWVPYEWQISQKNQKISA